MTDPKPNTEQDSAPLTIGIILFDNATLLDFAAPWDVFKRVPNATTHLIAHDLTPLTASGMTITPTTTWDALAAGKVTLDVVCVPGGMGHLRAMEDEVLLGHLRRHAKTASYVTAVCTGSLVLAAAGLLKGYRATTHWASLDRLEQYGARPEPDRVVIDRESDGTKDAPAGCRATGGGVTAGLDFALALAAELRGEQVAKTIQLGMEYAPAPPFDAGHPSTADAQTLASVKGFTSGYLQKMAEVDSRALERLKKT